MPIPSGATFLGIAKETTPGTPVAATDYIPVAANADSPNDLPHTASDTNLRGSAVDSYDEIATQVWAEPSFSGNAFVDSIGHLLKNIMGEEAVTGAGVPYTHAFTLLNSGNLQPPAHTLTDYNGDVARYIPGARLASLGFKWTSTGLLVWDGKFSAFKSQSTTKPTQSFGTERAKPGWQSVTTLGGSSITSMEDGELTLTRAVDVVPSCSGAQDPYAIWAGNLSVAGKITLVYEAATFAAEYAKLIASTATTLDLNFTVGAAATLRAIQFHMSNVLYTTGKPTRGKSYVELPLDFKADGNVTDVGASGGYGPIVVTLKNARSTAY